MKVTFLFECQPLFSDCFLNTFIWLLLVIILTSIGLKCGTNFFSSFRGRWVNMSSLCAQQQDFDVNSLNSVAKFLLESTTETFQWLTSLCSNHGNKDLSELQCENNRFMCSRCSCGLRSRRHPGALLPSVAPCCSGPASLHPWDQTLYSVFTSYNFVLYSSQSFLL